MFSDSHMKIIYNLWKHAALVTSKNMTVAQLELLYDVISACINIHRKSFDNLIEVKLFLIYNKHTKISVS